MSEHRRPVPLVRLYGTVWCITCQHPHIPDIPAVTFRCASECGFGSWSVDLAGIHADMYPDHLVYPIIHTVVAEQEQGGIY